MQRSPPGSAPLVGTDYDLDTADLLAVEEAACCRSCRARGPACARKVSDFFGNFGVAALLASLLFVVHDAGGGVCPEAVSAHLAARREGQAGRARLLPPVGCAGTAGALGLLRFGDCVGLGSALRTRENWDAAMDMCRAHGVFFHTVRVLPADAAEAGRRGHVPLAALHTVVAPEMARLVGPPAGVLLRGGQAAMRLAASLVKAVGAPEPTLGLLRALSAPRDRTVPI
jgi:hypothetical protein